MVTYLARADVPLSVAMTTVSTLTAIVATPALAKLLVGKLVPVDAGSLLLSTLQARLKTLLLSHLVPVPYTCAGMLSDRLFLHCAVCLPLLGMQARNVMDSLGCHADAKSY